MTLCLVYFICLICLLLFLLPCKALCNVDLSALKKTKNKVVMTVGSTHQSVIYFFSIFTV